MASKLKKKELPSFEHLVSELKLVAVNGVAPVVQEIKSTSDFSSLVSPHLNKISGHSSFFQFKFVKEKIQNTDQAATKMYVKENSLQEKWLFLEGIKLLKSSPDFAEMKVSQFREELPYNDILKSVSKKYFPSLRTKVGSSEVSVIEKSWEKRTDFLMNCKPEDFQPFDIRKLKTQLPETELNTITENIQSSTSTTEAALTATFYPAEMNSFSVEDLQLDVSIVFYTLIKNSRPWIGLFQGLINNEEGHVEVKVQWLYRQRRQFFLALLDDGTPYTSRLEVASIMFSDVLVNTSQTGERSGPYTIKEIKAAYADRDNSLN